MLTIRSLAIRIFSPRHGHNRAVTIQFIRYLMTGTVGFAFDFTTLYILTDIFDVYYLTSSVVAFLIGLLVTYLLSIAWVFHSRNVKNAQREFMIFFSISMIALFLNQLFIWLFTEIAVLHYLMSKVLTSILIILWNFTARKILLFKNE